LKGSQKGLEGVVPTEGQTKKPERMILSKHREGERRGIENWEERKECPGSVKSCLKVFQSQKLSNLEGVSQAKAREQGRGSSKAEGTPGGRPGSANH